MIKSAMHAAHLRWPSHAYQGLGRRPLPGEPMAQRPLRRASNGTRPGRPPSAPPRAAAAPAAAAAGGCAAPSPSPSWPTWRRDGSAQTCPSRTRQQTCLSPEVHFTLLINIYMCKVSAACLHSALCSLDVLLMFHNMLTSCLY